MSSGCDSRSSPGSGSGVDPWFLTGFVDAEGFFSISVSRDFRSTTGFSVTLIFGIKLHIKDIKVLQMIQSYLGVGHIYTRNNVASLTVKGIQDLYYVVQHFLKYPLITTKSYNFHIFYQAYLIIVSKAHLTAKGMEKIITLKNAINPKDNNFNNRIINGVVILKYEYKEIPHPMWLSGFISGDGSFFIKYRTTNKTTHIGLVFGVTLHIKDKSVIEGIFLYLQSFYSNVTFNKYEKRENKGTYFSKNTVHLKISHFSDISKIIIPFFDEYPILGVKSLDFADFKKVAHMISSKSHLTDEGIAEINKINENMNRRRKFE